MVHCSTNMEIIATQRLRMGGVELFLESSEMSKKRETALAQQERLRISRPWGCASHSARWANASVSKYLYEMRNIPDDPLVCFESPGQQLMLWDCAIVLARFLEKNPWHVIGKTVIELGCGIGLPGMVAAKLGGSHVMLTDRAIAIENLEKQIQENEWARSRVDAACLDWSKTNAQEFAKGSGKFDVVLCSDLIYAGDDNTTVALVETIKEVCTMVPGALVLSCRELRFDMAGSPSREQEELFLSKMQSIGFGAVATASKEAMDEECQDDWISISLFIVK